MAYNIVYELGLHTQLCHRLFVLKCLLQAIRQNESELRAFLRQRVPDTSVAEDLLQEVFLRAVAQGQKFCSVEQPRAWLYRVTRNVLTDHHRRHHPTSELTQDIEHTEEEPEAVDLLSECIGRNLTRLSDADRDIVHACDLQNMTVKAYAQSRGISLPAAKARLLRARQRLRGSIVKHCNVRFDDSGNVCCYTKPAENPTHVN